MFFFLRHSVCNALPLTNRLLLLIVAGWLGHVILLRVTVVIGEFSTQEDTRQSRPSKCLYHITLRMPSSKESSVVRELAAQKIETKLS